MTNKSASIKAIQLVREVFESVHGNLGILKFNIEELKPVNGKGKEDSKKWEIICSFYETLGSTSPSKYRATIDLNDNAVVFKKISGTSTAESENLEGRWNKKAWKRIASAKWYEKLWQVAREGRSGDEYTEIIFEPRELGFFIDSLLKKEKAKMGKALRMEGLVVNYDLNKTVGQGLVQQGWNQAVEEQNTKINNYLTGQPRSPRKVV